MTQTKITFSYEEICDFSQPTVITMEVPERSIDMMCEYFQRFLSAAGYVFDEGEHIKPVKNTSDTLEFSYGAAQPASGIDGSYYFAGGDDHFAFTGSHVKGAYGEDIISFN